MTFMRELRTSARHIRHAIPVGQASTAPVNALVNMRTAVAEARFPLAVPSAANARRAAIRITSQLDNYLLPRVQRLDAALLVVVGGSTGAGKSTLVNSIVHAPVSAVGVLRPTTRAPLLVSHPADTGWFTERRVLPSIARTSSIRSDHSDLQVLSAPALTPGLALLDAPDIDSVVDANRGLATQLLDAADLWLFVTTAARYADAVPWELLRTARDRGTVLALVLDRVPPGAEEDISAHLRDMLHDQRLDDILLFVVPESTVDGSGLLPEPLVAPVGDWLAGLARDAAARAEVIRTTVSGAIRAVVIDVDTLAQAADQQVRAWHELDRIVQTGYAEASHRFALVLAEGALLRGDVLVRWQEFTSTGDLIRALHARPGRLRDSITTTVAGRPAPGGDLRDALVASLATTIEAVATDAAEQVAARWRDHPAGTELVTDGLTRPDPDLAARAHRLVGNWQRGILDLVREQGQQKRRMARVSTHAVTTTGLLILLVACVPAAEFADETLRQLARTAREDLLERVRALLDIEAGRFTSVRSAIELEPALPERLRIAAQSVTHATAGIGS